jgi:hypothetical protein
MEPRRADKVWFCSMELGPGLTTPHIEKPTRFESFFLNVVILLYLSIIDVYKYQSTQIFIVNCALLRHVSTQPKHHLAILEPYLRYTK